MIPRMSIPSFAALFTCIPDGLVSECLKSHRPSFRRRQQINAKSIRPEKRGTWQFVWLRPLELPLEPLCLEWTCLLAVGSHHFLPQDISLICYSCLSNVQWHPQSAHCLQCLHNKNRGLFTLGIYQSKMYCILGGAQQCPKNRVMVKEGFAGWHELWAHKLTKTFKVNEDPPHRGLQHTMEMACRSSSPQAYKLCWISNPGWSCMEPGVFSRDWIASESWRFQRRKHTLLTQLSSNETWSLWDSAAWLRIKHCGVISRLLHFLLEAIPNDQYWLYLQFSQLTCHSSWHQANHIPVLKLPCRSDHC